MNSNDVILATGKTCADWQEFRSQLVPGGDADQWQRAFDEFLMGRLELRYLKPIRILQEHGTLEGEGFSILAILCTLVEFLESTFQGKNYR